MAKSKTASFVVELGLVTHQNEQAVLDKRFKIAEKSAHFISVVCKKIGRASCRERVSSPV